MNGEIRRLREVALNLLKPTPAQLEHGLELHAASVVVDAYGFGPSAAVDGDALKRLAEAGADAVEIKDAVEEMHATRMVDDERERRDWLDAWETSGVTAIVRNAAEEEQPIHGLIKRLAYATYVTDSLPDVVRKALIPWHVEEAKRDGRHALILAANAVPLAKQYASVEGELRYIHIFHCLGVRTMHLTYNRRNRLGDGCAETADAGLSDFGRAAIAEMNRGGVLVDVAHSSPRTSLEAARASRAPVVASHSACADLHPHVRNKPDAVVRALADSGGYIGICGIPAFLGRSGDIHAMLDHVDHAVKVVGADHVAIGTDRSWHPPRDRDEMAKLPPRPKARQPWRSLWPENDPLFDPAWNQPHQMDSLIWTNWPLFTVGLVQRGHRDEDIRRIIGGNVLRVVTAALKTASSQGVQPPS